MKELFFTKIEGIVSDDMCDLLNDDGSPMSIEGALGAAKLTNSCKTSKGKKIRITLKIEEL